MATRSISINYTGNSTGSKSISNINPFAETADIEKFSRAVMGLTSNTYASTTGVTKRELYTFVDDQSEGDTFPIYPALVLLSNENNFSDGLLVLPNDYDHHIEVSEAYYPEITLHEHDTTGVGILAVPVMLKQQGSTFANLTDVIEKTGFTWFTGPIQEASVAYYYDQSMLSEVALYMKDVDIIRSYMLLRALIPEGEDPKAAAVTVSYTIKPFGGFEGATVSFSFIQEAGE